MKPKKIVHKQIHWGKAAATFLPPKPTFQQKKKTQPKIQMTRKQLPRSKKKIQMATLGEIPKTRCPMTLVKEWRWEVEVPGSELVFSWPKKIPKLRAMPRFR